MWSLGSYWPQSRHLVAVARFASRATKTLVAVGMGLSTHPPHGSRRAAFPQSCLGYGGGRKPGPDPDLAGPRAHEKRCHTSQLGVTVAGIFSTLLRTRASTGLRGRGLPLAGIPTFYFCPAARSVEPEMKNTGGMPPPGMRWVGSIPAPGRLGTRRNAQLSPLDRSALLAAVDRT
jgi:hypothetical protein